jgi:putative transposase
MHEFARERLALEVATLLPVQRGIRSLERLVAVRGVLQFIRRDHGHELRALAVHGWPAQHQIVALCIDTICPGRTGDV